MTPLLPDTLTPLKVTDFLQDREAGGGSLAAVGKATVAMVRVRGGTSLYLCEGNL